MARILVIDDEVQVRRSVRRILEIPGHEVHEAADGLSGLALHAAHPFDVVITDLQMPDFDGLEVIAGLRRVDPRVGVILISGEGSGDIQSRAAELGPVWPLQKPFGVKALQDLVHTIVGRTEG